LFTHSSKGAPRPTDDSPALRRTRNDNPKPLQR
jgi:hypothetical protein